MDTGKFPVDSSPLSAEEQQFEYLQEFEGLHITGKPFDFDMNTYRLTVTGKVDNPLSLTFEEVKALPSVKKHLTLNCPRLSSPISEPGPECQ